MINLIRNIISYTIHYLKYYHKLKLFRPVEEDEHLKLLYYAKHNCNTCATITYNKDKKLNVKKH